MAPESSRGLVRIGLDGRYFDAHHPGIGRYVFELGRALPAVLGDLRLDVLVDAAARSRFDPRHLASAGATLTVTGAPARGLRAARRLGHSARSMGVALWHAPFFATSFGPRVPRVVTIYDTIGLLDPGFVTGRFRRLAYRLLLRAAVARAAAVITLSQAAARDLVERLGVSAQRIAVTPAGVAERFRPPAATAVAGLRRSLGLPARFVLFLGTDRPHKNLDRLCCAWRRLRASAATGGADLVLAGFVRGRRDRGDAAAGIHSLGAIAEEELPTLLGAADLCVLPSLAEGFGLPLLEAMACGTPVACANIDSLVEVAGDAAEFFDATSVGAIAETLAQLLADAPRRHDLAAAGRRRAATSTWQRTAEATAATYRRVLGSDAPAH